MVKIETRCRIPIWRTFGRIQWHVIPEPPATFQGAATWRIQCHDLRAMCHIAGCCHRANSTACHLKATYHIAKCCHLVNSLSWFQCHMRHCRVNSPGEINVMIVPHCIRNIENRFSPYCTFWFFNAVWALTSGGLRIVSDTLVILTLLTELKNCLMYSAVI